MKKSFTLNFSVYSHSTDSVTLRNPNGDVVSTTGVLKALGSGTNTYQLKDDLVTYAYAFPTPGKANFPSSPGSTIRPTVRPVIKQTLAPTNKKVQSIVPTSRPSKLDTSKPTIKPTFYPSAKPTFQPSAKVTSKPLAKLTYKPSSRPSTITTSFASRVYVNEVADKGDLTCQGRDWVELYNHDDSPADISGWKLHDSDGPSAINAYVFPNGTTLNPKSYKVFCQGDTFQFGIGGYVTCRYYHQLSTDDVSL